MIVDCCAAANLQEKDEIMTSEDGVKRPAFIADCHLGKVAKYLRLMGFDTLYFTHITDNDLIRLASEQNRVIVTCDKALSERKTAAEIFLIKASETKAQLRSLFEHYRLKEFIAPFSRCIVCNTPLQSIEKEKIVEKLPHKVRECFSDFEYCPICERAYWHGDHYRHMKAFIKSMD